MNKFFVCTTLLVCVALSTACAGNAGAGGTTAANASGGTVTANAPDNAAAVSADGITADDAAPTDEASEAKVLYGEISEVIGNAFVIKEMEQPQTRRINAEDMGEMTEFTLPDGTVVPIGEDGKPDFSAVELPEGMTISEGGDMTTFRMEGGEGGPTMIQGDGAMPEGGGTRQIQAPERKYTGEEVEVIIPVGLPIMTRTRGENGIEETELALTNVKAGNIITITYKEDGESIDTVYVSQNQMMGGMAGGGDGFFIRGSGGGEGGGGGELVIITGP